MTIIKNRRDSAANWTLANPILAEGEMGFEEDTNKIKIGNGVAVWSALAYIGGGGTTAQVVHLTTVTGVVTIDCANAARVIAYGTVTGAVTNFTLLNVPAVCELTIRLTQDAVGHPVTLPTSWIVPKNETVAISTNPSETTTLEVLISPGAISVAVSEVLTSFLSYLVALAGIVGVYDLQGSAVDSSANGHNGTVSGTVTWGGTSLLPNKAGDQSVSMTGAGYIAVDSAKVANPGTSTFAIYLVIQSTDAVGSIYSEGNATETNTNFQLACQASFQHLRTFLRNSVGTVLCDSATLVNVFDGVKHHVIINVSPTAVSYIVDGVADAGASSAVTPAGLFPATQATIGATRRTTVTAQWTGLASIVATRTQAFTLAEARALLGLGG